MSVCELLLKGLCVISFRQETGNGVEAITLGESPRAPRNEGQGPVNEHRVGACASVYVCVCRQGPAGDLLSMSPPMIYLLCPYPTSLSAHIRTDDF